MSNQPCQHCQRGVIPETKMLCPHCKATGFVQEAVEVPQETVVQKVKKAVKKVLKKK